MICAQSVVETRSFHKWLYFHFFLILIQVIFWRSDRQLVFGNKTEIWACFICSVFFEILSIRIRNSWFSLFLYVNDIWNVEEIWFFYRNFDVFFLIFEVKKSQRLSFIFVVIFLFLWLFLPLKGWKAWLLNYNGTCISKCIWAKSAAALVVYHQIVLIWFIFLAWRNGEEKFFFLHGAERRPGSVCLGFSYALEVCV